MQHHDSVEHPRHPDERRLFLLLEKELNPDEAAAVGAHLHGCGKCQTRMRTLESGIEAVRRYNHAIASDVLGTPPRNWSGFRLGVGRQRHRKSGTSRGRC